MFLRGDVEAPGQAAAGENENLRAAGPTAKTSKTALVRKSNRPKKFRAHKKILRAKFCPDEVKARNGPATPWTIRAHWRCYALVKGGPSGRARTPPDRG
jgi:hypothetical protein